MGTLLIGNSSITFNIAKTFLRDLTQSIELWLWCSFPKCSYCWFVVGQW